MRQTGHKPTETLDGYIRPTTVFKDNSATGACSGGGGGLVLTISPQCLHFLAAARISSAHHSQVLVSAMGHTVDRHRDRSTVPLGAGVGPRCG
jgi:hypothetical protein